ncbi:MAG: LPS assembly lipoprotein LptE [Puniceicoccales bacterium]|jgi:hypothetical protein|nr:LPS assembly lipoprotein LptE [Puniceicoccales bacterium]
MRKIFLLLSFCALSLASGCLHYAKGSGAHLEFSRIYVSPVKNDSFAPQVQALLTRQIREKLANQQNLEIAPSPENSVTLEITIENFEQSVATTHGGDTTAAKSFNEKMTVICTLRDDRIGKTYFKNYKLSDSVECQVLGDYNEARHQIMPQLTDKLADKICEIVCNPW